MQSRIGDWDVPRIPAEDMRVKCVPCAGDCHAEQTRVFRTIMKGMFGGQTTLLFVFSVGGGKRKEGYKIGSWCSLEKFCGRAADGKLGYAGGAEWVV